MAMSSLESLSLTDTESLSLEESSSESSSVPATTRGGRRSAHGPGHRRGRSSTTTSSESATARVGTRVVVGFPSGTFHKHHRGDDGEAAAPSAPPPDSTPNTGLDSNSNNNNSRTALVDNTATNGGRSSSVAALAASGNRARSRTNSHHFNPGDVEQPPLYTQQGESPSVLARWHKRNVSPGLHRQSSGHLRRVPSSGHLRRMNSGNIDGMSRSHRARYEGYRHEEIILCTLDVVEPKDIAMEIHSNEDLHDFAKGKNCCVLLDIPEWNVTSIVKRIIDEFVEQNLLEANLRDKAIDSVLGQKWNLINEKLKDDDLLSHTGHGEVSTLWHRTVQGHAFIVPLGEMKELKTRLVGFGRLAHPLNLASLDESLTRFVVVVLGPLKPPRATMSVVETGETFATLLADPEFHSDATEARNKNELSGAVINFLAKNELEDSFDSADEQYYFDSHIPNGLEPYEFPCGGVITDVLRRVPHYASDFADGLKPFSQKAATSYLSTIVLLFFAIVVPAVAFGVANEKNTSPKKGVAGDIGVMEMLISQAICGTIFALFGGQPLTIVMTTGPVVIYIDILYRWSVALGVKFLPFYGWVGLWTAVFLILVGTFDVASYIRYCGRFTEEVFALLISFIFIYEAFKFLGYTVAHDNPAQILKTVVAVFGTYYVARLLYTFRRSLYLHPAIRAVLADFGPAISVLSMAALSTTMPSVELTYAVIPKNHYSTTNGRPWVVDLLDIPTSVIFIAIIPAFFFSIIFYIEHNIAGVLINRSENKLKKGPAYHYDMVVLGLMVAVCSFFGLPFTHGALPHSPMHVRALADHEEYEAHGKLSERTLRSRETRVTGLVTHILIFLFVFMKDVISVVPTAVLYGFFIYVGVTSLKGNHLTDRVLLWFTQPSKYPPNHFVRRVPLIPLHMFTLLQVVCFVALWLIKSNLYLGDTGYVRVDLLFPVVVILLIVFRLKVLPLLFTQQTLETLIGEGENEDNHELSDAMEI